MLSTTIKKFSPMQMFRIKSFQARRMTSVNSLWWERKNLCFRNRIKVIGAESGENERKKSRNKDWRGRQGLDNRIW